MAIDRARAYVIARNLLPPGPISVIDFGCRDGRGRVALGDGVRYLGLERSRVTRPKPGVDVRSEFKFEERTDIPTGFDAVICLVPPRDVGINALLWILAKAVKAGGQVLVGLRSIGERDVLKRFFNIVKVFKGYEVLLAQCWGPRHASAMGRG